MCVEMEREFAGVGSYDVPFPLIFERFYMPDVYKNIEAIKKTVKF
jgi:hypothetical protein